MYLGLLRLVFAVETCMLGAWTMWTAEDVGGCRMMTQRQSRYVFPQGATHGANHEEPQLRADDEACVGEARLPAVPGHIGVQSKLQMKRPSENSPGSSPFA